MKRKVVYLSTKRPELERKIVHVSAERFMQIKRRRKIRNKITKVLCIVLGVGIPLLYAVFGLWYWMYEYVPSY